MSYTRRTIEIIETTYSQDPGHFSPKDYNKIQKYCDKIKQCNTATEKHDRMLDDSLLVFYLESVGLSPYRDSFESELWVWSRDKSFKNNLIQGLEFLYYDVASYESKNFRSSIVQVFKQPRIALKLMVVELSILAFRGVITLSMVGSVFVIVYFVWFCFEAVFKFFLALLGLK
jgi:hypothetical protein